MAAAMDDGVNVRVAGTRSVNRAQTPGPTAFVIAGIVGRTERSDIIQP